MTASTARLPGVRFEVLPLAYRDPLPRMDIAGFIGFAARGPIDIPVLIEDAARFDDVFGINLPLAWDEERGAITQAQLGPAVRAFFRNGGRRCWVVRVAHTRERQQLRNGGPVGARTSSFEIPGLLRSAPDDERIAQSRTRARRSALRARGYQAARALARAPGSWADTLAINAVAQLRTVPVRLNRTARELSIEALGVAAGELVRIHFARTGLIGFLPARANAQLNWTRLRGGSWFQAVTPLAFSSSTSAQPTTATLLLGSGERPLRARGWQSHDHFRLEVSRAHAQSVRAGSWVRLNFSTPGNRRTLLMLVEAIHDSVSAPAKSASAEYTVLVSRSAWWIAEAADVRRHATGDYHAAIIELELRVRDAGGSSLRLAQLGLLPGHARYWARLPLDRELFRRVDRPRSNRYAALWQLADHPRFAVAGHPRDRRVPYVPLGVPGVLNNEFYQPPRLRSGSALLRDGLIPFEPGLFFDPDLQRERQETLLDAAFYQQHVRPRLDSSRRGRALLGLHALLPVEEISLIALPDAAQRGWHAYRPPREKREVPALKLDARTARLHWTQPAATDRYELEQSTHARFEADTQRRALKRPQFVAELPADSCGAVTYYRVRALGPFGHTPWSNTVLLFPRRVFEACRAITLTPPVLQKLTEAQGRLTVTWAPVAHATAYRLQLSSDPTFAQPRTITLKNQTSWSGWKRPDGQTFVRLAAATIEQMGPWSNTVWTPLQSKPSWRIEPIAELELHGDIAPRLDPTALVPVARRLLEIHSTVLRFCAARSDAFAILGMGSHFREQGTLAYGQALLEQLLRDDGERTLSFGALFHPWLISLDESSSVSTLRSVSPEGVVTGAYARRTLAQGAWSAPANDLLAGVVALTPPIGADARLDFFEQRLNQIRQQPPGFLLLSAQTLSTDRDLREVNVRRLLILLRRLALREGTQHVFDPNDDELRRLVRRRFEDWLADLFARGAFKGATHEQAYQVITDRSVNPRTSIDQGRLIVEIRVAPSQPLAFLTVRLLQNEPGVLIAEGA